MPSTDVPCTPEVREYDVGRRHVEVEDFSFMRALFGGDQLTAARARGAAALHATHKDSIERLDSLIPGVEDWHATVALAKVRFTC